MSGHNQLAATAAAMVADGKGILAADESTGTITKRFKQVGIESTEDSRRAYREMLFTTPGLGDFVSGAILYDETIRQSTSDGIPIPKVLEANGIMPGIKVDTGAKPLAGFPGELVTEGLDGLRDRLAEYSSMGARFTKWRAVITIGEGIPTRTCIEANAEALARYAALVQEAGLVPIVEPEVLMDGDHGLERCYEVTVETLRAVFARLAAHRIALDGMILKPNMAIPAKNAPRQASVEEVAEATVRCMREAVPSAVRGIAFLSGGQSDQLATAHLDAMNRLGPHPWPLSFSYARALQNPALHLWAGREENVEKAQRALHHRAKLNSVARSGQYSPEMEEQAA